MDNEQQQQPRQKLKDPNAEYQQNMKVSNECGFSKMEIEVIFKLFKKYDPNKVCSVTFHEAVDMLHDYGFIVNQQCKERIFKDLEDRNTHKLDFQTTLFIFKVSDEYEKLMKKQEEENMSSEYCIYELYIYDFVVDAFVALGGKAEGSGFIKKDSILNILSNEFELVLDMDDLLERIEVSNDDIDFDSFKKLFKISDDPRSLSKASSVLSLLSSRSRKSTKSTTSVSTVKIRMKDFERYMAKIDQEEKEREQETNSLSNTMSPLKKG